MPSEPKDSAQWCDVENDEVKRVLEEQVQRCVERDESWDDNMWHGELTSHSWKHGRSGSSVTRGEDIRWWPNYDGVGLG